jgi:hypothetical protein
MRHSAAGAALVALVLALAACGGSSSRNDKNASAPDAAKCLREKGARVSGDPARKPPGGDDAPDRELVAAVNATGAFIAFYATEAAAKRLEPGVRANAKRFKGVVVRDQNTTIVYTKKPSDDVRKRVEGCVF